MTVMYKILRIAKIGKATKTLTFAIVGLVVCFIAVVLVNYVMKTFLGLG